MRVRLRQSLNRRWELEQGRQLDPERTRSHKYRGCSEGRRFEGCMSTKAVNQAPRELRGCRGGYRALIDSTCRSTDRGDEFCLAMIIIRSFSSILPRRRTVLFGPMALDSAKSAEGSIYQHERRCSKCKECGGSSIYQHGRRRSKECGGSSIYQHGRRRSKECGGSSITCLSQLLSSSS